MAAAAACEPFGACEAFRHSGPAVGETGLSADGQLQFSFV